MDTHDDPTHLTTPSQVDLVRALESIDHSGLLTHHDDLHAHDSSGQSIHQLSEVGTTDIRSDQAEQLASQNQGVVDHPDNGDGPDKELDKWTRKQLQAEIVKLRRLTKWNLEHAESPQPTSETSANTLESATQDVEAALKAVRAIEGPNSAFMSTLDPSLPLQEVASTSHMGLSIASGVNAVGDTGSKVARKRTKRKRGDVDGDPSISAAAAVKRATKRDEETGKRLEKERRTELGRAIRIKMRTQLGVGMDDPLPHPVAHLHQDATAPTPTDFDASSLVDAELRNQASELNGSFIPNWLSALNDEVNVNWVKTIAEEIHYEAMDGQHPRIPVKDTMLEIIEATTKTAFTNMCKRYVNENDPKGLERREKYTKKRRRWARKDLKQKRRARSSADPSFSEITLPNSALHIDYMSSEYSSSDDDDDEEGKPGNMVDSDFEIHKVKMGRKYKWAEMLESHDEQIPKGGTTGSGKGGWAVGVSEKTLEVRTPKWRSSALNDIYRRLDAYANEKADSRASGSGSRNVLLSEYATPVHEGETTMNTTAVPRPGHVAPSHKRFTLPPDLMRKGKLPRDVGEGWMWASGIPGVWPNSTSEAQVQLETNPEPHLSAIVDSAQLDLGQNVSDGWGASVAEDRLDPEVYGIVVDAGDGSGNIDDHRTYAKEADTSGLVTTLQGF